MRLRALVLVPLTGALALGGVSAASADPTPPQVGYVTVAGSGPGDLVRAVGTGFAAGSTVSITLVDPDSTVVLGSAVADSTGRVSVPAGTRLPATAAPGEYLLGMTGPDGVTATSPVFGLQRPQARMPAKLFPGAPGSLLRSATRIALAGLANSPDAQRSVTVDGTEVPTRWYSDANAFYEAGIAFSLPATLPVGDHVVVFTQTGPTPYSVTAHVPVVAPSVSVGQAAPRSTVRVTVGNAGWRDELDVRVTGAAHDVHTATLVGNDGSDIQGWFDVAGLSVGPATITVTSRHNGAVGTGSLVVDGAWVTSPGGLASGQRVVTGDGDIQLAMQPDGNLVYGYVGYAPTWSTRTQGHPGARLVVQSDGNVVVYAANGQALWATGTNGIGPGARFGLDAHREITVFTASGRQAYSTFIAQGVMLLPNLTANHSVFKGQSLAANLDGRLRGGAYLGVQGDGNVVLRTEFYGIRWSTRTQGHANAYLVLQSDGNLVVRAGNGTPLWANGVRATGARLVVQNDGNVVEYSPAGKALWATGTVIR